MDPVPKEDPRKVLTGPPGKEYKYQTPQRGLPPRGAEKAGGQLQRLRPDLARLRGKVPALENEGRGGVY